MFRDSTRVWPQNADRVRVDAGTLVIERAQTQIDGPCRNIDFDPLVLPAGIEPSGDPLLAARSAAYMESFSRRMAEEVGRRPATVVEARAMLQIKPRQTVGGASS